MLHYAEVFTDFFISRKNGIPSLFLYLTDSLFNRLRLVLGADTPGIPVSKL